MRFFQKMSIVSALLSLLPIQIQAKDLQSVRVLNSEFHLVSQLIEPSQIAQFEKLWASRENVPDHIQPSWSYKLDLNPGGRWLYDPKGYIQRLAMNKTKPFKLPSPHEFNTLLGIEE